MMFLTVIPEGQNPVNNASPSSSDPASVSNDNGPTGLGGWLIPIMAGLVVGSLAYAYMLAFRHPVVFSESWAASSPPFKISFVIRVLSDFALATLGVSVLDAYFRRSRYFQKYFIAWILLAVVSTCLWESFLLFDPAQAQDYKPFQVSRAIFGLACVWLPYLLTARRVRNTFTR